MSIDCTVLLWRSWWGLTTTGCDPDGLNYFRMEKICLLGSRTLCFPFSGGSSWRKGMMLEVVWRLGTCQIQDPVEQGLKESSSAPCIPGPKWRHWMLSKYIHCLNRKHSYSLIEEIQLKETFFRHGWLLGGSFLTLKQAWLLLRANAFPRSSSVKYTWKTRWQLMLL